jgi:hypothetical protein
MNDEELRTIDEVTWARNRRLNKALGTCLAVAVAVITLTLAWWLLREAGDVTRFLVATALGISAGVVVILVEVVMERRAYFSYLSRLETGDLVAAMNHPGLDHRSQGLVRLFLDDKHPGWSARGSNSRGPT